MNFPAYYEEPFNWYRKMRGQAHLLKEDTNTFAFTYDTCRTVLDNHRIFSSQFRDFMEPEMAQQLNKMASPSILVLDPPAHTKLRNLVSKAFTPKQVASYTDEIRTIARSLLNDIKEGEPFDLVKKFSFPLPVIVISRILGVPEKDMGKFKLWSDKLAESLGRGVDLMVQADMAEYFGSLIEERRKNLDDDLISLLIEAEIDGERLANRDIVGFAVLLLAAGNETTTNLISNGVLTLHENPDSYDRLMENSSLVPGAVEEMLRYRSPVQSTRRIVKEDFELENLSIKRGEFVFVYLGSANRDENVFPEPEEFKIERTENRHIAFGEGIHFCLGAPLARLEGKIAFEELTAKFKQINILGNPMKRRLDSDIMYGFNALQVSATRK